MTMIGMKMTVPSSRKQCTAQDAGGVDKHDEENDEGGDDDDGDGGGGDED